MELTFLCGLRGIYRRMYLFSWRGSFTAVHEENEVIGVLFALGMSKPKIGEPQEKWSNRQEMAEPSGDNRTARKWPNHQEIVMTIRKWPNRLEIAELSRNGRIIGKWLNHF